MFVRRSYSSLFFPISPSIKALRNTFNIDLNQEPMSKLGNLGINYVVGLKLVIIRVGKFTDFGLE